MYHVQSPQGSPLKRLSFKGFEDGSALRDHALCYGSIVSVLASNSTWLILPFFNFFASLSSSANDAQSSKAFSAESTTFFSTLSARVLLSAVCSSRSSSREDAIHTFFLVFCTRLFSLASFLASCLLHETWSFLLFVFVESRFESLDNWTSAADFNRFAS